MICPRCHGSGKIVDPREIGARVRKRRIGYGMSLRGVARDVGISAAHLSDMELGRRGWDSESAQKVLRYVGVKP